MSDFSILASPPAVAPDPTKHVRYSLGMILGVDDLNQEFAYLAQRDQWILRDLVGYGTVWGLALSVPDPIGPRGPEIAVSSGVAVNPRGQLIRVAPAQCAAINDWLVAHLPELPSPPPATASVDLYVVLSYAECLTDPVPIAGEPCRTESDSVAPSRIADELKLELRFAPPPEQTEEDALREFVDWLRAHVTVVAGGVASMSVADFVAAIRAAAAPPMTSPPSGGYLGDTSPPVALTVPAGQAADYLRAAFLLWITELRPRWRPDWLGNAHDCGGGYPLAAPGYGNDLLLGRLTVGLTYNSIDPNSPRWEVQTIGVLPNVRPDIVIDESRRPWLLHMRFLQEWALQSVAGSASGSATGPVTVAAGIIVADGTAAPRGAYAGLVATAPPTATATYNELTLTFGSYQQPPATGLPQYVVKVTPWSGTLVAPIAVAVGDFLTGGFTVRVSKEGAPLTPAELKILQVMVEVTQYA
jgi:hypothetical protein